MAPPATRSAAAPPRQRPSDRGAAPSATTRPGPWGAHLVLHLHGLDRSSAAPSATSSPSETATATTSPGSVARTSTGPAGPDAAAAASARTRSRQVRAVTGLDARLGRSEAGVARLTDGARTDHCLVEGQGEAWVVTLRGRRIPVSGRTWRERVLAEAESAASGHAGPVEVRATLPGLVVAVAVSEGDEVAEGARRC